MKRTRPKGWTIDEFGRVYEMFGLGESNEAIAAELGRSPMAIHRVLYSAGLFRTPPKLYNKTVTPTAKRLLAELREREIFARMRAEGAQYRTRHDPGTERPVRSPVLDERYRGYMSTNWG